MEYSLAGLDFLVDKQGEVYFLEANSFPGFLREQLVYNLDHLKQFLRDGLIVVTSRDKPLADRFINLLKTFTDLKMVFIEDNVNFEEFLISENEEILKKGKVFCRFVKLKSLLSKNFEIVNSEKVSNITRDKWLTYQFLKMKNIKQPLTYLLTSVEEAKMIIKINAWETFVVKPRFGSKGVGVRVLKISDIDTFVLDGDYLLQEYVDTNGAGQFWDVRALVVNGKYIGAIRRVSNTPVTNIYLGGEIKNLPAEIDYKVMPLAEEIVKKFN